MGHNFSLPHTGPTNYDPTVIAGNVSAKHKELLVKAWGWRTHPKADVFGSGVMRNARLLEANIVSSSMGEGSDASRMEAQTIAEVTVTDGMVNEYGTLSGPCAIYILEHMNHSSCLCLGLIVNASPQVVSTALNVQCRGTVLRLVGTTVNMNKRGNTSRAEMYDKKTGNLVASLTHTLAAVLDKKTGTSQSHLNKPAKPKL
ncbi:hypothetical protein BXZ70DRAFT_324406 [Cristinia sonorae]|uniref:Uncharacterized protein n=1 Tax=Cristinia sonorae TaxID=1940300 RepID=A0A8K0UL37_9AGAR|nr:hypothetical protein BXZ70DRAFT_324406 [Cristinia sonorae]